MSGRFVPLPLGFIRVECNTELDRYFMRSSGRYVRYPAITYVSTRVRLRNYCNFSLVRKVSASSGVASGERETRAKVFSVTHPYNPLPHLSSLVILRANQPKARLDDDIVSLEYTTCKTRVLRNTRKFTRRNVHPDAMKRRWH